MQTLIADAWAMYRSFEHASYLVRPSIPILFFGDSERCARSAIKIITVGLNPSREEFPVGDRFMRFPVARAIAPELQNGHDQAAFIQALNTYFRQRPYTRWFNPAFEKLLNGLDGSFYDTHRNIALHTDLCSPLATDPTWSRLPSDARARLEPEGVALWHRLVEQLRPDVIIISVARFYLGTIRFPFVDDWQPLYHIHQRRDGTPVRKPYVVQVRRVRIDKDKTTLLVFGQAANTPFGTVSSNNKIAIGRAIKRLVDGEQVAHDAT